MLYIIHKYIYEHKSQMYISFQFWLMTLNKECDQRLVMSTSC